MSDAGNETPTATGPQIQGRWERVDASTEDLFPAGIEFRKGTYLATKGSGQRFIQWDAGTYELTMQPNDPRAGWLTLSTATDSLETYPVSFEGGALEVAVEAGRTLRFARVSTSDDT
jgi:hypothetical protein